MLELYHDGFQAGNNTVFKSKHVSMFFMKAIVYIQNMFKLLQHVATMIDPWDGPGWSFVDYLHGVVGNKGGLEVFEGSGLYVLAHVLILDGNKLFFWGGDSLHF